MNNLNSLALMCILILTAGPALADDRSGRRADGQFQSGGWRLGERLRDGYAIYHRSGRGWYRVPGSAIAVADGWALGANHASGGYAIYRWNGYDWDRAPGGAVRIGGSYHRPWVINNRGQRFTWNGYDWYPDRGYGSTRGHRNTRDGRYDRLRDAWRSYQPRRHPGIDRWFGHDRHNRSGDNRRGRRRSDW